MLRRFRVIPVNVERDDVFKLLEVHTFAVIRVIVVIDKINIIIENINWIYIKDLILLRPKTKSIIE